MSSRFVSSFALCMLVFLGSYFAGQLVIPALSVVTNQRVVNSNALSTRNLLAPSALTANAVGHSVNLSWSAGQNGSGYALLGVNNGTSSNCSGATFSAIGSTAALTYTDSARYTPQGTWFCYQAQTTHGSWSSQQSNPIGAVQLGFVATSVQLINAGDTSGCVAQQSGVAGELDCGDQIVLTFNQAVDTASGPSNSTHRVCAHQASGTLWLGSTTLAGDCTASETVVLGKLLGGTLGGCDCRFDASYAWTNGNKTLTVTIATRVAGSVYPTLSNAIWTFTPTSDNTKLLSASGGYHICDNNSGGGNCLPATSVASQMGMPFSAPAFSPNMMPTATRTPAPTATPTATATAAFTATPSRTPTATRTRTPAATSMPSATPTADVPTATPMPTTTTETPSPMPTATPLPATPTTSATPVPATPAASATPSPLPSATPSPTSTPTRASTSSPTSSPTAPPTSTPSATATPKPASSATPTPKP